MPHVRSRGIFVVAALMVAFGVAEVTTGFTHDMFGIVTRAGRSAGSAGVVLGVGYAAAGLLLLPMRRRWAAIAVVLLVLISAWRLVMLALGRFPISSPLQVVSITAGIFVVVLFVLYIGWRWAEFT